MHRGLTPPVLFFTLFFGPLARGQRFLDIQMIFPAGVTVAVPDAFDFFAGAINIFFRHRSSLRLYLYLLFTENPYGCGYKQKD